MTKPSFLKPFVLATLLSPLAASSCDSAPEDTQESEQPAITAALTAESAAPHPERRGIGLEPLPAARPSLAAPVEPKFDAKRARRSLAVTDVPIVSKFSFKEVMDKIAGGDGLGLFQRWWATQGSTCESTLNNFDYPCRPFGEGQEETNPDPFGEGEDGYMALGLFNRFDLAPTDGANCGEYRVVFGRRSGATNALNRNLIIFEAVLPNPTPDRGLEGCRPVANFWHGLSTMENIEERATALKSFYFRGLVGFAPVIEAAHFAEGAGQVRTNQFMQFNWSLREFKFQASPQPTFKPVTVKTNPHFELFDAPAASDLTPFQSSFVSQIPSLRSGNINTFNYSTPAWADRGDSDEQDPRHDFANRSIDESSAFARDITNAGASAPTSDMPALNRTQLLNRATALSCAGCHQHSNGKEIGNDKETGEKVLWPSSLVFVHISENTENTSEPGVDRHIISPALLSTFLPHRQIVSDAFLARINSCTQTTLTHNGNLQPDSEWGKDAVLVDWFDMNFGGGQTLPATTWGNGSGKIVTRALIDFDLSPVAPKSSVTRAALRLFATGTHGGSNAATMSAVTQPWDELTVKWSTQPTVDSMRSLPLSASTSIDQGYVLNVTPFINAELAAPGANHGMLLQLVAEQHHNQLEFHSSDSTQASQRPLLGLRVSTPICSK